MRVKITEVKERIIEVDSMEQLEHLWGMDQIDMDMGKTSVNFTEVEDEE